MSIDRLKYFAAVVETRNLRKAAELVGISPPSMSKAISVLEDELGFKLTHPEGRGIGITPKGLQVYRNSTSLLEEHRRFYQRLNETTVGKNQIRLATFEVFSSYFMSTFIAAEKQYEFLLLEKTPGRIEEAILSGTVDYGLTYIPSPNPSLEYTEVGSFQMKIFGRKEWSAKPFSEWPFAIPITELKIHSSEIDSMDMWPKNAPRRLTKHRFELLETALQTSALGLSVLHCPEFIVHLHNARVKAAYQLDELDFPAGYGKSKSVKVFLVSKKGTLTVEFERKLGRKENPKQLEISASGYTVPDSPIFLSETLPVSPGSKIEKTVYLKGYYRFKIHLKNLNCSGPTDSVFVKFGDWPEQVRTGCQDNLYTWGFYLREPSPTFTITSKKNGVSETTYHQASLSLTTVNTVYINY